MTTSDFHLADFLPYLLNQAAEESSQDFAAIYRTRYGLQRTEWRVLVHLGEFGGMTATEIGRKTREHKTRISRAVGRLEQMGFLARKPIAGDRRTEQLALTSTGQGVYADLIAQAAKHDAKIIETLGLKDAQALKSMLSQLAKLRNT